MNKLILTIAVPTYNIEQYISKCIKSFDKVELKYKNLFEVLIVNDGSTDNTAQVVQELIAKSNNLNIRIINKENGGHGSAVNKGIEEAKGKYFKIVDGDDWVNKSDFEEYLNRLKKTDVDMIITNYSEQHVYENRVELKKVTSYIDNYRSDKITEIYPMHSITYKTKILQENNIRLTEKIFYVDTQYTVFPLIYVEKWIYLDLDVYQYFLGRPDQSMAIENRMKNIEHHRIVVESILEFYSVLDENSAIKSLLEKYSLSLVNDRFLISFLSENKDKLLRDTAQYVKKYNLKYTYDTKRKTSWLLYANEMKKRRYSFIVFPLARYKLNKMIKKGI